MASLCSAVLGGTSHRYNKKLKQFGKQNRPLSGRGKQKLLELLQSHSQSCVSTASIADDSEVREALSDGECEVRRDKYSNKTRTTGAVDFEIDSRDRSTSARSSSESRRHGSESTRFDSESARHDSKSLGNISKVRSMSFADRTILRGNKNNPADSSSDVTYPKSIDEFFKRLENSNSDNPAYLPMIVTREFAANRDGKSDHVAVTCVSVKRGMVVSAAYKKGEWISVLTPEDKFGCVPAYCVHPLGLRVQCTDFSQQYPESSTVQSPGTNLQDTPASHASCNVSAVSTKSLRESFELNDLDCLTMRNLSRSLLTRMAIMRARDEYCSPELSFCVNYNQGSKRRNIALLHDSPAKLKERKTSTKQSSVAQSCEDGPPKCGDDGRCREPRNNATKHVPIKRTHSRSSATQTTVQCHQKPSSILKNPLPARPDSSEKHLCAGSKQQPVVDTNNNDATVTASPWWSTTPSVVAGDTTIDSLRSNLRPTDTSVLSINNVFDTSMLSKHNMKAAPASLRVTYPNTNQHQHQQVSRLNQTVTNVTVSKTTDTSRIEEPLIATCAGECHSNGPANNTGERIYENLIDIRKEIELLSKQQPPSLSADNISDSSSRTSCQTTIIHSVTPSPPSAPPPSTTTTPRCPPCSVSPDLSYFSLDTNDSSSDNASSGTSSTSSGAHSDVRTPCGRNHKNQPQPQLTVLFDYDGGTSEAAVHVPKVQVSQNEVVTLLCDHLVDWFWIRCADGRTGYIPKTFAVDIQELHLSFDPAAKSTYL